MLSTRLTYHLDGIRRGISANEAFGTDLARPKIAHVAPVRVNGKKTIEVGSQDVEVKERHRISHHSSIRIKIR